MKKKILAIAMTAIVAALGLTGCNNGMGINDDGTYTWKMALNFSPQKIWRIQNNRSLRTCLHKAGAQGSLPVRM